MPPFDPGSSSDVVILGGGIAGIAAALELLDAGRKVTLVESRNFLGGRAFSFTDVNTGLTLDNGQHVIVGCCTEFISFLDQLGVRDRRVPPAVAPASTAFLPGLSSPVPVGQGKGGVGNGASRIRQPG